MPSSTDKYELKRAPYNCHDDYSSICYITDRDTLGNNIKYADMFGQSDYFEACEIGWNFIAYDKSNKDEKHNHKNKIFSFRICQSRESPVEELYLRTQEKDKDKTLDLRKSILSIIKTHIEDIL